MSTDSSTGRHLVVVHDVLGTLFSLTKPIEAVLDIFAPQLGADRRVRERYAELIVMDWYHCGQRDFSMLSLNGAYKPIGQVFKGALNRVLLMSGLLPPQEAAKEQGGDGAPASSDLLQQVRQRAAAGENVFGDVVDRIFATLPTLEPRPGVLEAFSASYRDGLLSRQAGISHVSLWGATNGSIDLAKKLFNNALASKGVELTDQSPNGTNGKLGQGYGIWSCDEIQVAKPDPRVYQAVKERVAPEATSKNASLWFVASHTWDTDAAKRAG